MAKIGNWDLQIPNNTENDGDTEKGVKWLSSFVDFHAVQIT